MNRPIVFMFSGQGSQYHQMGRELFENHPRFKLWMKHCDSIVKPMIDRSLIEMIYHADRDKTVPFDQLTYTNPALLSFEYCLAKILMESNVQPDYLLGYSLGELTSLVVSGAVSLEDGLRFSVEIAELAQRESPKAGMLAIIDSTDIIRQYPELFGSCWVTAKNFESNFVVGGLISDIDRLRKSLLEKNIVNQLLPVNYGFHTKIIEPLKSKIIDISDGIDCLSGNIPMLSSLKPHSRTTLEGDYIWQVFRNQVDFSGVIESLIQNEDYTFIDVGPSGTLATFVKYLLPPKSNSQHLEVINQFGRDLKSLEKVKESLSVTV